MWRKPKNRSPGLARPLARLVRIARAAALAVLACAQALLAVTISPLGSPLLLLAPYLARLAWSSARSVEILWRLGWFAAR